MVLKEEILINATPEQIWPLVSNFENIRKWNPKLKTAEKVSLGENCLGSRWMLTYELSQKEKRLNAEVVTFDYPFHFKAASQMANSSEKFWQERYYEEYRLTVQGQATKLQQTILIEHEKIPLILKFLIWFIRTFGKPVGKPMLEQLKELVEQHG
jgi:hypothetical protein